MTLRLCLGRCGQLVSPGPRCSSCQRAHDRLYAEARPAHHTLYATAEWRRLSLEVRASATRCTWCLKPTRRLVADHVLPLDQRPDLALDRTNLVPACVPCNTRRGRNAKLPDLISASARPEGVAGNRATAPDQAGTDRSAVARRLVRPAAAAGRSTSLLKGDNPWT
jgi:hypothetical protein